MFFVNEPALKHGDDGQHLWSTTAGSSQVFSTFVSEADTATVPEELVSEQIFPTGPVTAQLQERAGIQSTELFFTAEEYMCSAFLSFTFASSSEEPPGSALIDTAAQRGLIGAETLAKLDSHLQKNYKLRVQYTQEEGGTVRGVCGSEQVTRIAFVPISLGGRQEFFVFRWFQERFHV